MSLFPADAIVVVTVVLWLASVIAAGRSPRIGAPGIAVGIAALSVAAGWSARDAREPLLALGVAAHLAVLVVFFLAAVDLARRWPAAVVAGIALAVAIQAIAAAAQAVTQATFPAALVNGWPADLRAADRGASVAALPFAERWLRGYGTFAHPNILGIFAAASLAVLALAQVTSRAASRWRDVAVVAGSIAITLSLSRLALAALFAGGVTALVATHGRGSLAFASRAIRSRPALFVPIAILAVGIALAGSRLARLDAFPEQQSIDARERYEIVASLIARQGDPVGAGGIVLAQQPMGPPGTLTEPAHNVFLLALAEMGIAGIVAWAVLGAAAVAAIWHARHDPARRTALAVALAVLVPVLTFDHHLWTQPNGRTLMVWTLALLMSRAVRVSR